MTGKVCIFVFICLLNKIYSASVAVNITTTENNVFFTYDEMPFNDYFVDNNRIIVTFEDSFQEYDTFDFSAEPLIYNAKDYCIDKVNKNCTFLKVVFGGGNTLFSLTDR